MNKNRMSGLSLSFVSAMASAQFSELNSDFTDRQAIEREWYVVHKQWGGENGGVVKDNVLAYSQRQLGEGSALGIIELVGHGARYQGAVVGVDKKGYRLNSGQTTEVGAAIASKRRLGPGQYRARVKYPSHLGAASAMWTFHYEEFYQTTTDVKQWQALLNEGLHPQGSAQEGYYIVRNHEIDIEVPTALKLATEISYHNARLNNWIGEARSEFTDAFVPWTNAPLNDDQWHVIGFDWHTYDRNPGVGQAAQRIDFYLDGKLIHSNTTHVPDIAARLWFGIWYPRAGTLPWAGALADYETDKFQIDWVTYQPYVAEPVRMIEETYPLDGLIGWNQFNFK
jgi:hypothetical protein